MKLLAFVLAALCSGTLPRAIPAEMIAQWDFNGSALPSFGQGTARLVGGITAAFATGSTNDPALSGNLGWNTTQYPAQGTDNQCAGAQFSAGVSGYTDIMVRWEHRVSNTASKYCRLQYSTNGYDFLDAGSAASAVATAVAVYEPKLVDLTGLAGVDDNPDFAFKIVSEFESSVWPNGTEEYVTTYGTNQYSRAGTIRLDLVTISGTRILGTNSPPRISAVPEQTVRVGQSTGPLAFTISDAEDAVDVLVVSATSSDPSVIPDADLVLSGAGADRSVNVSAGSQTGVTTITLKVSDRGGRSATTRFPVSVLPANTPPVIAAAAGTNLFVGAGSSIEVPFTVFDLETTAEDLAVTVVSGNTALVPNDGCHLRCSGQGSNRFVAVAPWPGVTGSLVLTVTACDGVHSTHACFPLAITPAAGCVFYEPFNYAAGSVVTNSGLLWARRGGTGGDCQVAGGELQLSAARTEDVVAPLPGAPYAAGNGQVLYASFRVKFLSAPKSTPEYYAHFLGPNAQRARVYTGASEAWPGTLRLYIANGSITNSPHAAVLSTNTYYTVVTRYDIDRAASTLWVNPASEAVPGAIGPDLQTPVAIDSFGFRQEGNLGATVLVDHLKVGLSFTAVTVDDSANLIRLAIEPCEETVVLRWNAPGCVLQAGPDPAGQFTNVSSATSPFTNDSDGVARFFKLHRP